MKKRFANIVAVLPAVLGVLALLFVLSTAGCTGNDDAAGPPPAPAADTPEVNDDVEPQAEVDVIEPAEEPEQAQNEPPANQSGARATVADVYPHLVSGALTYARLADLPDGVLLRAGTATVTEKEVSSQFENFPAKIREEAKNYAFLLLENVATTKLLVMEAVGSRDAGGNENKIISDYLMKRFGDIAVADAEIEEFYKANTGMFGGATLEQVRAPLKDHLVGLKQQEAVNEHIRTIGRRREIEVSASWTKENAAKAMDNDVDRARASGIPTFASFGADSCAPCQMMKPIRAEIEKEYAGRLNVVYVHVDKQQLLGMKYGVQSIPHLIFFDKDGKAVLTSSGFMGKAQIEENLKLIGVE